MSKQKKTYDFSGYATKVGIKCSDGRTILQDAFAHCDGKKVPLVYQHLHNDPKNVLGHAVLENRPDGVYAYCSLNNTEAGKTAKALVQHGDISALSIYANSLVQKSSNVIHGVIREVSLVLSGANPEAYIDNLAFEHSDGSITTDESEAFICSGAIIHHGIEIPEVSANQDSSEESISHADDKKDPEDQKTVGEVFDTLNAEQKTVVYTMIAQALETQDGEDEDEEKEDVKHSNIEGDETMKRNIFDKDSAATEVKGLSRADLRSIFNDARQSQSTLKNAFLAHGYESISDALADYEHQDEVLAHAATYGIDNIGYLFPDARTTTNTPQFIKRDTEWVSKVFGAAKHLPFSRIKTVLADITADAARATCYIKCNE